MHKYEKKNETIYKTSLFCERLFKVLEVGREESVQAA